MNFSTTGTLQSFQSSDEVNNNQHERLEQTLSWDEERSGAVTGGDPADHVSLAQAIQNTEFLRSGPIYFKSYITRLGCYLEKRFCVDYFLGVPQLY